MIRLFEISCWIGIAFGMIGFTCLAIVQKRHATRFGGQYRSLLEKPVESDMKLLKFGLKAIGIGAVLIIIAAIKLA